MEKFIVRILNIEQVTHDVKRFHVEKPVGYSFIPGQATEVSINTPELKEEKRPFTFTCLNDDPFLEFIIKIYPSHNGVTNELNKLVPGDELIIRDVWGAINYIGKGIFIAGGAGITPFIAIIRDLNAKKELEGNKLLFANKTKADIILENELKTMMGNSFVNILSEEDTKDYHHGFITKEFLEKQIDNFHNQFYVCGPQPMIDMVLKQLDELGADKESVTIEL